MFFWLSIQKYAVLDTITFTHLSIHIKIGQSKGSQEIEPTIFGLLTGANSNTTSSVKEDIKISLYGNKES